MMTRRWILGLAAVAALAACKKNHTESKVAKVAIDGSGSTFQAAFEESAIDAYTKAHSNVTVNYAGGGSGKGRQDLADMITVFAGSDSAYKDEDLAKNKGGEVLYFPVLLGPITLAYNAPGVDKLQLSAQTIAKIFQRDIKQWNDPAIAADNPGVNLPATDITVVHRADGSGTTDNFTKYLDKAATGVWKLESGSTVEWPADTRGEQGNGGVAGAIGSTAGAIGYVDLSDAKGAQLKYASVKNAAGKYIEPTSASASAAAETVEVKANLMFSALDATGDAAYPITYQSWVIVYAKPADKAKGAAVKDYLNYLLTDGQKLLPELDFAPLPKALADKAIAQLAKIQL